LLIADLMNMLEEIVGDDLASIFIKAEAAELGEEVPSQTLPLTPEEESWIREAISIYLNRAGIDLEEGR